MKKILIGSYQCESNTFANVCAAEADFEVLYGEEAISRCAAAEFFLQNGFEVAAMPFARALPSGKVKKTDYLRLLTEFVEVASQHKEACGVYMYFHGAMQVEGLGSGEEYCIKELRKVLGNNIPISVACDCHGLLSDEYLASIQALSAFRTIPHVDYDETERRAANALVRIVNENLDTHITRFHLPVLLADAAVTAREPYKTIMEMLKTLDVNENVVACSVLNGQPWVDAEYVGASVVVSHFGESDTPVTMAREIADTFWARRNEFCFEVPAQPIDDALTLAKTLEKPVFFSDSGDNTTAGTEGKSTFFMQKILASDLENVLITAIYAPDAVAECMRKPLRSQLSISLPSPDEYSDDCVIEGRFEKTGVILGFSNEEAGHGVVIRTQNADIILSDVRTSFISREHFDRMNLDVNEYDYVVFKMGYLWPGVSQLAKNSVFVLTPGTSTNDFTTLTYKNLKKEYFMIK